MGPERCGRGRLCALVVQGVLVLACAVEERDDGSSAARAQRRATDHQGARVAAATSAVTDARDTAAADLGDRATSRVASPTSAITCELVDPPPGFVDLRLAIRDVRVVAGYHRADNFSGAPLPGYEAAGAWLRADAAAALAEAADELARAGFGLVVYDAYRPRRASRAMVAWARAQGHEDLLEQGWIAARSAHNEGRAIDVGLFARGDGQIVDMGSAWDHFGPSSFLRAVEGSALERRLLLRDAMVRAGFVPYAREWWHFTWPDSAVPSSSLDRPYACASGE